MKEVALDWSLVTMVNNDSVLRSTLLASPALTSRCQVVTKRNFECAGRAYNAGLQEADHEIVVLAHQDVYLPETWLPDLSRALALLAASDPQWGVLGVFGIASSPRRPSGYCYSTGLRTILGHPYSHPIETDSLDELVLIVRRSAGLRFDERLPGFHLYGTDICLQARSKGLKNYIIPAFCIHNSNGVKSFPVNFWRAYLFLRRKWWDYLPVRTCCTTITRGCFPALKAIAHDLSDSLFGARKVGTRVDDVVDLYRRLSQNSDLT